MEQEEEREGEEEITNSLFTFQFGNRGLVTKIDERDMCWLQLNNFQRQSIT